MRFAFVFVVHDTLTCGRERTKDSALIRHHPFRHGFASCSGAFVFIPALPCTLPM